MTTPLLSLIRSGTKLWLDSIDPDLVVRNRALGATGATSNPIIVADLIKTGRFDGRLQALLHEGKSDNDIAWALTDQLVREAQKVFEPVWRKSQGNDGYVSFELDPLLEDPTSTLSIADRAARYVESGKFWSLGHTNRMIKIPATPAGLAAVEALAAAGVTLNVTLIFTSRQYRAARDAIWRGAQKRTTLAQFKSVYSIFVSRVDVYTEQHTPSLTANAQGQYGIFNAKQIWRQNQHFWADKKLPLQQEIVFASTGVKNTREPASKYVAAFAGSDIQTNPPKTNDDVEASGLSFDRQIDELPPASVAAEFASKIDIQHLEDVLMSEGIKKFADPQKALLKLIADKRHQMGV